jgi:hypothetical protein
MLLYFHAKYTVPELKLLTYDMTVNNNINNGNIIIGIKYQNKTSGRYHFKKLVLAKKNFYYYESIYSIFMDMPLLFL